MSITDTTPTSPDFSTVYQPHSPRRPAADDSTVLFCTFDPQRYYRDDMGNVWLIYNDGSRQHVEAVPAPVASTGGDKGDGPFCCHDLTAALIILLVIFAIGFITVIAR
jgi:hypothetical protein